MEGGFGSYLLSMSGKIYEQADITTPRNTAKNVKDPSLGWIIGFPFVVSFVGLLVVVLLRKIFFEFNSTYRRPGMIFPHVVNLSILFGVVISSDLTWPIMHNHKGDWYNATDTSMQGLHGYRVFVSFALILGDQLYNFFKIMVISGTNLYSQRKERRNCNGLPVVNNDGNEALGDAMMSSG